MDIFREFRGSDQRSAHIFFPDSNLISLLDGEDDCDPLPNFPLWLRKRLGFDCKIIDGKDCQSDFPTAITAKVLISATSYFKRRDIFLQSFWWYNFFF